MRSGNDLRRRPIHFSVKLECRIRTAFQVPIERSIVSGGSFLMELRRVSGHGVTSLNCVCALLPMAWSWLYPSPTPRCAIRSRLPRPPVLPRLLCRRGSRSANRPAPLVPRPIATAPAPAAWKLPVSSVPSSPTIHADPQPSRSRNFHTTSVYSTLSYILAIPILTA